MHGIDFRFLELNKKLTQYSILYYLKMVDNPEQFDGLLMTCLQQGGGITNFFDSIFGFLQRKSDFFADESKYLNITIN